jgi:MoxR-like ATPase
MTLPLDEIHDRSHEILDEVEKAIVGKRDVLELVLMGILAGGHVLLEDYPGLAKTLVARSFAQTIGIDFNRVQFTPDLLPADITGSSIYDQKNGRFDFRKGPVFTNLLLGDEINRAPPKTQAALLEAMQEGQVSAEGITYPLDPPFVVIATENPIEYEGTYPLPEAQLDRFMMRIGIGYPDRDGEWEILKRRIDRREDEVKLRSVVDGPQLLEMQHGIEQVYVGSSVGYYMVDLVTATRASSEVQVGASPRGALALLKLARCRAVMKSRDFVTPDDVKRIAVAALAHRLTLRPELWVRRIGGDDIVRTVLDQVPTPEIEPAPPK